MTRVKTNAIRKLLSKNNYSREIKKYKYVFLISVFYLCGLNSAALSSSSNQLCKKSAYSIIELESMDHSQIIELSQTPKNLFLDNHRFKFVVKQTSTSYILPSKSYFTSAIFDTNYEDVAVCRIRDYAGQWWYALRDPIGGLTYISGEYLGVSQLGNLEK